MESSLRSALRGELEDAFQEGAGTAWPEVRFNRLALAVFRRQVADNRVYGAFVHGRGIDPGRVESWRDIPPVPVRGFQVLSLACEGEGEPEAVFRTSGTMGGGGLRGVHPVRDLSLYRGSLLAGARAFLRPELEGTGGAEADARMRVVALLPDPADRPDSSLAFMAGALRDAWDDGVGGFFAAPDWTLDVEGLEATLRSAKEEGVPVLLLGTAFAFVHWLDAASAAPALTLPPGSRIMETGGFKGRSRVVAREALYDGLARRTGVPAHAIVNEYGMTELLSQFYEPVLREGSPPSPAERRHVGPPWMRTLVLDPRTLEPLPEGREGLLCHVDLANLDSVSAILTEDRGIHLGDGFRLLGRVAGAEPRGCSLAMEDLLRVREARP